RVPSGAAHPVRCRPPPTRRADNSLTPGRPALGSFGAAQPARRRSPRRMVAVAWHANARGGAKAHHGWRPVTVGGDASTGCPRSDRVVIRSVVFDVGETLLDDTREFGAWADWIGVPRHTFSALLAIVGAQGP